MRTLGFAIKWLGNILLGLAVTLILVEIGYGWYQNGFGWFLDFNSPFNITSVIVTGIALAPGYGLKVLGERIISRNQPTSPNHATKG